MDPTTKSFVNMVSLLKRRLDDTEYVNKEMEMLNSVSAIFSRNKPSVLMVHSKDLQMNETNKAFIQAVEKLENYHIEEEKISIENARLCNLQKEINASKLKLTARRATNNKLKHNVFQIFNTNTTENFLLTPQMQITFK